MEPHIQYASTSDGVSIAFWRVGEGLPLVCPPPALPWSHIELEWQIPEWRHWYEHLMETFEVVRYDNRGSGLSTHEVDSFDLMTHVADLEAVVDRMKLDRFALYGMYFNAPIVIAYAVRHPERVSHLFLWCAITRVEDSRRAESAQLAFERLMELDYTLFTETLAHSVFGWEEGDAAHRVAQYMRESMPGERAVWCWQQQEAINVEDLLPQVQQPTLVTHRRDFELVDVSVARRIASKIPNARLRIVPGKSLSPYVGELRGIIDEMQEFTGVTAEQKKAKQRTHAHADARDQTVGFRAVMFTDIEESTALTQRLGDAEAQEIVRLHNSIVESALARHGGQRVKHTGDGIMASFHAASPAVEAATEIQQEIARHNEKSPETRVGVRIGINAGEPVVEGDDLFGTSVQLASRVCSQAEPSEILTTDVVRQLLAGKGFMFASRGEMPLRGFEDPVRLYEVRWQRDAP